MRTLTIVAVVVAGTGCVHRTALMDLQDCLDHSKDVTARRCSKEYDACVDTFGKGECTLDSAPPDEDRPVTPSKGDKQESDAEDKQLQN